MKTASVRMHNTEIDLKVLKNAVDAVLDHLMEDVGLEKVKIDDGEDFYWDCEGPEKYDSLKKPADLSVGRLSDDVDFMKLIRRGEGGDVSYNLVHVAPLLRYIAEKVKQ
jgi:hypothetical protein